MSAVNSGHIWTPGMAQKPRTPKFAPGRPVGKPAGSYIDGLVANANAIVLCELCHHKFDYKLNHYHRATEFGTVAGKCDDCREPSFDAFLFINEKYLTDPGGRSNSSHTWIPK